MKTRTLLTLTIILSAVLLAGCVQIEQPRAAEAEVAEPAAEVEPEPEEVAEPETLEIEAECTTHEDCYDDDECTSDSCKNGACVHTLETGCEQKKTAEPHITAVNFGEDEWIQLYAENYRVDDWTIENQEGKLYYTFKDYTTLNNYLKIYSGNGFATTVDWYLSKGDFWNEGDTIILKDANGHKVDEKTG